MSDDDAPGPWSAQDAILSRASGSSFKRVDLHVHTPGSQDMADKWRASGPDDVVRLALAAGLDVIAVTDHNSVEWCERVMHAAAGTGLSVLPGVEISTSEGHVLAVFHPGAPISEVRDLLVRAGISAADAGNLNALTNLRIDDVADQIEKAGGVAIAAHLDGPKGFWTLTAPTGVRRQQIHACSSIRAFELHDPALAEQLWDGSIDGYPRQVPSVQGSDCWPEHGDAHQLDAIGRRHCLLRLDEVSIHAIRQALADPELRLRPKDELPLGPRALIEGLAVSGGFLDGAIFRFNRGVSCLIGGTGAGKSLTLELIRFVLDQEVNPNVLSQIARETADVLAFGLGNSATVRVLLRKDNALYLAERTWLDGRGLGPVVSRVDGADLSRLDDVHIPSFFPIKAFSQGEIIEYAREPLARLSLVDDLLDLNQERSDLVEIRGKLRRNATEWIETRRELASAREDLRDLPGVQERIGRLASFLEDPRIRAHDGWYAERAVLDEVSHELDQARASLESAGLSLVRPNLSEVATTPRAKAVTELAALLDEADEAMARHRSEAASELEVITRRFADGRAEWQQEFDAAERTHQALLAEMDKDGVGRKALHEQLTTLREQERRLSTVARSLDYELEPHLKRIESDRDTLLTELAGARRKIRDKRKAKAQELTSRLDRKVVISIRAEGDGRAQRDQLNALRVGSRLYEQDIDAMVATLHPIPLVKSLLNGDYETLATLSGLDAHDFEKFMDTVVERGRMDELLELQTTDREDVVRIRFEVDREYRELEALAHGQKCTVVLMVSMAEGESPLLVDQPEDALHAPWIEDYIVSSLRGDRDRRQCLFATRSANVLVSADAEQVIGMKATANKGWIEETGGLDRFETRALVLYHVEGGEKAFLRRHGKYAIP
jgi:hypothetical protein